MSHKPKARDKRMGCNHAPEGGSNQASKFTSNRAVRENKHMIISHCDEYMTYFMNVETAGWKMCGVRNCSLVAQMLCVLEF